MNSWLASNCPGDEHQHYSGWSSTVASTSDQPSPGRREHAVQPPLLTTVFSGPQFQGRGIGLVGPASTPLSSTSLSSPFTQGQSPSGPSSGNARSAPSSAMVPRHSSGYNVPYNPQDWGPVGDASARGPYTQSTNMLRIVPQQQRTHSDMSLSPPPPPYSPPSNQHQPSRQNFRRSADFSAASPAVSRPQASSREGDFELPAQYQQRSGNRPRPQSMIHIDGGPHPPSLPPPPPPQGPSSPRSVSHSRIDAYQGSDVSAAPRASFNVNASTSQGEQSLSSLPSMGHALVPSLGQLNPSMWAPASRRAASTGAVVDSAGSSRTTSQSRNLSPSGSHWEPGMPLPPPPPGPPPTTRSLSVSGSPESSIRTLYTSGRPRARPPPVLRSGLGSIPPTPGDWVDEEYINSLSSRDKGSLHIDTALVSSDRTENPDANERPYQFQRTPESGGGLFRSPAIRDSGAKGIRERRIERRSRQSLSIEPDSAVSASTNPWADALEEIKPSDLILAMRDSPDKSRHPTSSKFTPRSTRSLGSDGQLSASRSRTSSTGLFSDQSSYSTPRPDPSPAGPSAAFAHTPPFSPNVEAPQAYTKKASQAMPPKALPTPPPNPAQDSRPRSRAASRGTEDRPVSHIIHFPNDTVPVIAPLSPRPPAVQQTSQKAELSDALVKRDSEFVQNAIKRHNAFIEKESGAADECEALKIFTEFIITESQIRRERYVKVWATSSFDTEKVRRKLFEMPGPEAGAQFSSNSSEPAPVLEMPPNRPSRPESAWWNSYQPCLSPIASLSMSNDEKSSRGRAPSRWWESNTGSSSQGAERKVQRSKRESKYMGLPREAMLWDQERTPSKPDDRVSNNTGQHAAYGPDEYPPEKVGWHEEPSGHSGAGAREDSEQAVESQKLDISRLITLTPPYPRHHPAVNNSHPDLFTYRTTVRSITDLSEIKSTRQRWKIDVERILQEHQNQVQEGHRQFKSNIQSQIQEGGLTFAEAAEAEAAMIVEDNKLERELVKRQLDTYQETVLSPMHTILSDRISRATACIDELSSMLFDDARHETPDQAQEEGDEKPELLEKLTQLKWLFEAREQLHREVFDLISDRDEKYKAVALLPYTQNKNEEKIRETQAFFAQDAIDRKVQYEAGALERFETFLNVIEQNVVRGVEVQLSAFWDIAPSLLALIQQVPEGLDGFQVQIPAQEYEENPSYRTHPLQYLYTLLSHAERSSYQYIESQTNLLCLLHEVRSSMMRANGNLMEAERIRKGEPEEKVCSEMQTTRSNEELMLTTDLKDKVATVEGQWAEALGSQIQALRERVKEQLLAEDGWEDLERLEQE